MKNIIFEIAKRYVSNFLDLEIKTLETGNSVKILAIETKNRVDLKIQELDFPVKITGKVDRIDEFNGVMRIIDYKTGKVEGHRCFFWRSQDSFRYCQQSRCLC